MNIYKEINNLFGQIFIQEAYIDRMNDLKNSIFQKIKSNGSYNFENDISMIIINLLNEHGFVNLFIDQLLDLNNIDKLIDQIIHILKNNLCNILDKEEYHADEYYKEQISKLQYNTDLVTITFKAIEDIKVKVNDYLYQNNGTKYLKMAYEEILWPCAFLSKKKYFGIPHENIPNFKPADMFIRGLEVKKRGVSEILKIICLDIMWESLDLKNTKTLRELIIQKIKEIFIKKWELKDFIQTGLWKPEKKNVTLNEFAERMKEENKTIPEPGERFNYVIIKKYPYK